MQNVFVYGMNNKNFLKAKEQIMQHVEYSACVIESNQNQQELGKSDGAGRTV